MAKQRWRWVRRYRDGYAFRFTHGGRTVEGYGDAHGAFKSPKAAFDAAERERRRLGLRRRHARENERALSFAEAVEEYLRDVGPTLAASADVSRSLRFAAESWGPRRVNDITSRDVAEFKRTRLGQTWCQSCAGQCDCDRPSHSPCSAHGRDCGCPKARPVTNATVNRDLAYLSAFFVWCADEERGYLDPGFNPASRKAVPRGKEEPQRVRHALTEDQKAILWSELPPKEQRKAKLIYFMGIRPGVIFGLDWQRVHWDDRLISFESKGKWHTHPFNESAYKILRELWEEQGCPVTGRVFSERTDTTLRKWWARARTKLGLPKLRRHDLRITFARDLHDKGAGLGDIQDLMGHATLSMTRQYVGESLAAQRRALSLLDGEPCGLRTPTPVAETAATPDPASASAATCSSATP